jgi:hypothetical protein
MKRISGAVIESARRRAFPTPVARPQDAAGIMTVTLHLDDAVAEALAAEAARRGQTADQLAEALLAAQLPKAPRRRLAFAAVGASTSGRSAAEADEMLADGFGRD